MTAHIQTETRNFAGTVTRDPEIREHNGSPVVNIDFAMNKFNGQSVFVSVSYWGTQATIATDFLQKGDSINGSGDFYWHEYTGNDGIAKKQLKCYGKTLSLDAVHVIDLIKKVAGKMIADSGQTTQPTAPTATQAPTQPTQPTQPTTPVQSNEPVLDITADDLPF